MTGLNSILIEGAVIDCIDQNCLYSVLLKNGVIMPVIPPTGAPTYPIGMVLRIIGCVDNITRLGETLLVLRAEHIDTVVQRKNVGTL